MANKPKYLSRFTYGNVVSVHFPGTDDVIRQGVVVAVKFTVSDVFYDVSIKHDIVKDIRSQRVDGPGVTEFSV